MIGEIKNERKKEGERERESPRFRHKPLSYALVHQTTVVQHGETRKITAAD